VLDVYRRIRIWGISVSLKFVRSRESKANDNRFQSRSKSDGCMGHTVHWQVNGFPNIIPLTGTPLFNTQGELQMRNVKFEKGSPSNSCTGDNHTICALYALLVTGILLCLIHAFNFSCSRTEFDSGAWRNLLPTRLMLYTVSTP